MGWEREMTTCQTWTSVPVGTCLPMVQALQPVSPLADFYHFFYMNFYSFWPLIYLPILFSITENDYD